MLSIRYKKLVEIYLHKFLLVSKGSTKFVENKGSIGLQRSQISMNELFGLSAVFFCGYVLVFPTISCTAPLVDLV